jgi:hypothetical protein
MCIRLVWRQSFARFGVFFRGVYTSPILPLRFGGRLTVGVRRLGVYAEGATQLELGAVFNAFDVPNAKKSPGH